MKYPSGAIAGREISRAGSPPRERGRRSGPGPGSSRAAALGPPAGRGVRGCAGERGCAGLRAALGQVGRQPGGGPGPGAARDGGGGRRRGGARRGRGPGRGRRGRAGPRERARRRPRRPPLPRPRGARGCRGVRGCAGCAGCEGWVWCRTGSQPGGGRGRGCRVRRYPRCSRAAPLRAPGRLLRLGAPRSCGTRCPAADPALRRRALCPLPSAAWAAAPFSSIPTGGPFVRGWALSCALRPCWELGQWRAARDRARPAWGQLLAT